MRLAALLFAGFVSLAAPVGAEPLQSAQGAMEQLRAAEDALRAASGAQDRVAALTETVTAYEEGLAALREGLRQASAREAAIRARFDTESERLAQLLGVLQSIETAPEPHLLFHPQGPLGTVRSGLILSDVTPALSREAVKLRDALTEIATLRALQQAAVTTLEQGLSGVQEARTSLSKAIANRTDLPKRLITDEEAMETLVSSADTLEAFAGGLLSASVVDTAVAVTQPDFAASAGTLAMPVIGRVIRRMDEADAAGVRRPGWVIATRPLTMVTTPWPATIRYLGPLLSYGQVAILEPGEGYLLVLAGLGTVLGEVGDVIPLGTPVGLMGGAEPGLASENQQGLIAGVQGSGAEATETLYMELRRNGAPVDPAGWFAAN